MAVRKITVRRGTQASWASANPVLSSGEIGYETDTNRLKIGDGTTAWISLTYFANGLNSDNPSFAGATLDAIRVGITASNEIDTATGNLTIDSAGGTVTIDDNLTVSGNLTVNGTTTTVNAETINLADNTITLNSNVVSGSPSENAGIEVSRGSSPSSAIRWNESTDLWETSTDGTTYIPIVNTTATQTLTNKTLSLGSNTISGTTAEFNTALTDGDFATIGGTETLTGKTLTSPTINSGTANNLTLTGSLTAGGGTGTNGQVLQSTGSGVAWATGGGGAAGAVSTWTTVSNLAENVIASFDASNINASINVYGVRPRNGSVATWKLEAYHNTHNAYVVQYAVNTPAVHADHQLPQTVILDAHLYSNGTFWERIPNAGLPGAWSTFPTNLHDVYSTLPSASFPNSVVDGFDYNGTRYVVVDRSKFWHSTDLLTWTSTTHRHGGSQIRDFRWLNGAFRYVGDSGIYGFSTDGLAWTTYNSLPGGSQMHFDYDAINGRYGVMSANGVVRFSTDFITWTTGLTGNTNGYGLNYVNGRWIAGYTNFIRHSTDGVTWATSVTNTNGYNHTTLWHAPSGKYYVGGQYCYGIASSTDLTTWTTAFNRNWIAHAMENTDNDTTSSSPYPLFGIVGANNVLLWCSDNRWIYRSTDGTSWGVANTHMNYELRNLVYNTAAQAYYLAGQNGMFRRGYAGTDNLVRITAFVSQANNTTATHVTVGPVAFKTLTLPMSGA